MTQITHLNYTGLLKQSTVARGGAVDGNVFFNQTTGEMEMLGVDELANINHGKTSGAIQINVVAAARTFTRLTGSFITAGFRPGMHITGLAFANAGNNVTKIIESVTALVITVTDGTGLVNETGGGDEVLASASQANEFVTADGITMRAIYRFENQERVTDEVLRGFKRFTDGDYRFAGAFSWINGNRPAAADRPKVRGSGWIEYDAAGDGQTTVNRIYHGVKSLNSIQSGTTSYWTLTADTLEATLQAATWTNFARTGAIDEALQVFGAAAHGNFDYTERVLTVRTRSWQYNAGETTSVLTGIAEFSGFSAGYGVGESLNTNNTFTLADVYGGAQIAPWTGMTLELLASPVVVSGFNEADGSFSWRLNNTGGGTVDQCTAYLDAVALQDANINANSGVTGTYNGKRGRVWYSRNAAGDVVTSQGLYIAGLATSEQQGIIQTDNAGNAKTYPFFVDVQITVGAAAIADLNAWYHVFYVDGAAAADFDTANAVTVNDAAGNPVKGNVAASVVGGKISFSYAYDTNTQAGLSAGVPKDMVVLVEGDGGASQGITFFTVTESAIVPVTCAPGTDTNS